MKRSLHNRSLTLRHMVTLALLMEFSSLWKHCYRFTHASFHKVQYKCTWLPLSACHCLAELPAKMCAFSNLMQPNACYCNVKQCFSTWALRLTSVLVDFWNGPGVFIGPQGK